MKQASQGSWKMMKNEGDFYTMIYFSFKGEEYLMSSDVIGLSGLEQINEQLLVQRRVLLFVSDGFQVIQSKERTNWTLGKAKKIAAKITREIMCEGGMVCE